MSPDYPSTTQNDSYGSSDVPAVTPLVSKRDELTSVIKRELTVQLVDGADLDIADMDFQTLQQLQWEQERLFAAKIKSSVRGTEERSRIISQAYVTVCMILDQMALSESSETTLSMGMDPRYTKMVLHYLKKASKNRGSLQATSELNSPMHQGGLFEVGFGTGILLEAIDREGFRVGGLEVAPQLLDACSQRISESGRENLLLGDFLKVDLDPIVNSYDVVYWNDVFEHVPTDEIQDYLARIYSLLSPGGYLITITPNWHMRPMDVTADFCSPRTEAIGFHLKEYTLCEVDALLKNAGFSTITTPLFVGKKTICLPPECCTMTGLKKAIEPMLEWMPYAFAVQACRRFGFCCTIAQKPE